MGEVEAVIESLDQSNLDRDEPKPFVQAKKKPSPLEIPIILVGWIKDVIASFTKPKPSKPVIDIPRREPQPPPNSPNPETPNPIPAPETDNWEESNWDD